MRYKTILKLLKVAQGIAILLICLLMARAMKLLFFYMQGN